MYKITQASLLSTASGKKQKRSFIYWMFKLDATKERKYRFQHQNTQTLYNTSGQNKRNPYFYENYHERSL